MHIGEKEEIQAKATRTDVLETNVLKEDEKPENPLTKLIHEFIKWTRYIPLAMELESEYPDLDQAWKNKRWQMRYTCPVCKKNPLEHGLSKREYFEKYPVSHLVSFGDEWIYLCETHYNELKERIEDMSSQTIIKVE